MLAAREELVETTFLGLYRKTDCAFYFASPVCNFEHEPLPHDPERAKSMLEQAGWVDRDGDGVREKGGRELSFGLTFPFNSQTLRNRLARA